MQRGSSIPHFDVTAHDGRTVRYSTIWQQRNLLLVTLPSSGADAYLKGLAERSPDIAAHDAECVITRDSIPGVPSPAVVIADRWGEVMFVASPERTEALPVPDEIIEWLAYAQVRCPECEGEAR